MVHSYNILIIKEAYIVPAEAVWYHLKLKSFRINDNYSKWNFGTYTRTFDFRGIQNINTENVFILERVWVSFQKVRGKGV